MQIPSNPAMVRRRMSELDREMASLNGEIQRQQAAGQSTRELRLQLDELRRQRALLTFYQDEAPKPDRKPRDVVPQQQKSGVGVAGCVIGILVVVVGLAVVWLMMAAGPSEPPPAPAPADVVSAEPLTVEPSPARPEPKVPTDPFTRSEQIKVTWQAKIKKVSGLRLAAGVNCQIHTELVLNGEIDAHPRVQCQGLLLYRYEEAFRKGVEAVVTSVTEATGQRAGTFAYTLSYFDPRHGVSIDTRNRRCTILKRSEPAFEAELEVEPLAHWDGPPLTKIDTGVMGPDGSLKRSGRATAAEGRTGVKVGDRCTLVLSPAQDAFNCRILLQCGGAVLYGSGNGGFNLCQLRDGKPIGALDNNAADGDPIFWLDLPAEMAEVSDDQPGQQFSVEIDLRDQEQSGGVVPAVPATRGQQSPPLPSGKVPQPPVPAPTTSVELTF